MNGLTRHRHQARWILPILTLCALLSIPPALSAPYTPSLGGEVAWWRLDANDVDQPTPGLVADASGHGNHLRLVRATPDGDLLEGYLDFSGAGTRSERGDGSLDTWGAGPMALALWVRAEPPSRITELVIKRSYCGQAWPLAVGLTGSEAVVHGYAPGTPVARVGTGADHIFGPSSIADGKWHHLVYSRDDSTVHLFMDGAMVATLPATTAGFANREPVALGGDPGCGGANFEGDMDDVRLFNRALTDAEAALLHLTGLFGHL